MEFEEQNTFKSSVEEDPFLNRIFGTRIEDISSSTSGGYQLLKDLPTDKRVIEFYGGAGVQSTIIRNLLRPKSHTIIERDPRCVEHLRKLFGHLPSEIICGDARDFMRMPADLYFLDWNTWTIAHWGKWDVYWKQVLSHDPVAFTWYDTGKPYFHTNKDLYSKILGRNVNSISEYSHALSEFLLSRYGYSLEKAVYCPRATYYLAMEGRRSLQEFTIKRGSGGFVWITESIMSLT